jgi:outer membrane protein assembly factor BamE
MNTTPHTTHRSTLFVSQMRRLAQLSIAALALSLLAACGSFLYKAEIAQGNFVSKEQVAALKPGMPRLQVADILGTPLLVSVFHADRWEYVFSLKRQGIDTPSYKLTVYFKGDLLDKVDGSEMPTEQEFIDSLAGNKK